MNEVANKAGKIPQTPLGAKAKVDIIKHRVVGENNIMNVNIIINGLSFERTYTINKSLNQNEMIDFITDKIKEEQETVLITGFEVNL